MLMGTKDFFTFAIPYEISYTYRSCFGHIVPASGFCSFQFVFALAATRPSTQIRMVIKEAGKKK